MANALVALHAQGPDFANEFNRGADAAQGRQMNALRMQGAKEEMGRQQATHLMDMLGAAGMAALGGDINGQPDPEKWREALTTIGRIVPGIDVDSYVNNPGMARTLVDASITAQNAIARASDDRAFNLALQKFDFDMMDANRKYALAAQGDRGFRMASPEEAASLGAAAGQFGPDGRFYPLNPPSGMTIETADGTRIMQGSGAKFTEAQSKDNVFSTRARGALPTLNEYETALTSLSDKMLDSDATGIIRGRAQSEDYQVARTAGDEFLQAILRKDTGAAITQGEHILYGKTYLPQPGDGPRQIEYKRNARERAIAAIESGMSPAQMVAQEKALAKAAGISLDKPEKAEDKDKPKVNWGIPPGVTEEDVQHTMRLHGMTREQVLEYINAR